MSHRADLPARLLADRHYNRQKVGTPQFMPTGSCVVFLTECGRAVWGTSAPFAEHVKHAWAGAWVNSIFRNEGAGLSSELIREAVAATLAHYGDPPALGMVTFVDAGKVRSKRVPGWCYRQAGFEHVGFTEGGLWAWRLRPERMPPPQKAKPRSTLGLPLFTLAG